MSQLNNKGNALNLGPTLYDSSVLRQTKWMELHGWEFNLGIAYRRCGRMPTLEDQSLVLRESAIFVLNIAPQKFVSFQRGNHLCFLLHFRSFVDTHPDTRRMQIWQSGKKGTHFRLSKVDNKTATHAGERAGNEMCKKSPMASRNSATSLRLCCFLLGPSHSISLLPSAFFGSLDDDTLIYLWPQRRMNLHQQIWARPASLLSAVGHIIRQTRWRFSEATVH